MSFLGIQIQKHQHFVKMPIYLALCFMDIIGIDLDGTKAIENVICGVNCIFVF